MTNAKATALLVLASAIWGCGYVVTQFALDAGWTPLQIIAGRFMLGGAILTAVFHKTLRQTVRLEVVYGAITGACLLAAFTLQTVGQIYSTPAIAAFITAAHVVMIPFFDKWLFKVKLDIYIMIAVVLTLAGVSLISVGDEMSLTIGITLILAGAVFYALQLCTMAHFVKKVSPVRVAVLMIIFTAVGGLLLAIVSSVINNELPPMNFKGLGAVAFLGVFSTAVCFLSQGVAMKHISASKSGIILSTECIFGAIVSVLLYNEVLRLQTIIGCAIIFLAVILAETKLEFLKRRPS